MTQFLQAVINGLALGGMYTVLVLGFSVIWGVMGVINFAHGEFVMVGAYLAWLGNDQWGIDPFLAVPAVFVVMMVLWKVVDNSRINSPFPSPSSSS